MRKTVDFVNQLRELDKESEPFDIHQLEEQMRKARKRPMFNWDLESNEFSNKIEKRIKEASQ